jgi:hypothetical protein
MPERRQLAVGDVVSHKSTGDKLLILSVKANEDLQNRPLPSTYYVRTPTYQRVEVEEFEIEKP